MSNLKITKFHHLNGVTNIDYVKTDGKLVNEQKISLETKDEPTLALKDSLHEFGKFAKEILVDLDEKVELTPTGLTISYFKNADNDDMLKVKILSKWKITGTNDEIACNTPARIEIEPNRNEDIPKNAMPNGMSEHAWEFLDFVEKFINGDRVGEQKDLFEDQENEKE